MKNIQTIHIDQNAEFYKLNCRRGRIFNVCLTCDHNPFTKKAKIFWSHNKTRESLIETSIVNNGISLINGVLDVTLDTGQVREVHDIIYGEVMDENNELKTELIVQLYDSAAN